MKITIGVICGVIGMMLSSAIFIGGMMAGYALARTESTKEENKTE